MGFSIRQNQTAVALVFGPIVLTSDHLSSATGKTLTVTLSKNGGAFNAPAGAVTEVGNGIYEVAGNATDANTLGSLQLYATAAACDPFNDSFLVVAYDPFSANSMITGVNGQGPPANWSAQAIDASGRVDLSKINGSAINNLISGRVDANAQVVGDKTAYALTGAEHTNIQTDANNAVVALLPLSANVTQWKGTAVPSPNVAGVPITDLKYTLGTLSPAPAGLVRVDSVTAAVTVGTNNDKTSYTLTVAEHTTIASVDVPTGFDARGYTTTRAGYLDNIVPINQVVGLFSGLRNTVYSGTNLVSYDLCTYDTSAHAVLNDGATGLIQRYSTTTGYDGSGNITASVTVKAFG